MRFLLAVLLFAICIAVGLAALVQSGWYDIGADAPHTAPVRDLMQQLRERSVEHHAAGVVVPDDLADAARIGRAAGNYDAMCAQCHRHPGERESELSAGLYPKPPALAEGEPPEPAEAFWVIRHGIKMSAMPAWGGHMDDAAIWDLVAFLQALPKLDAGQYRTLVQASGGHHHGGGEHEHAGMHEYGDMDAHEHMHEPEAAQLHPDEPAHGAGHGHDEPHPQPEPHAHGTDR